MRDRYARHVAVDGFGPVGHAALRATSAAVDATADRDAAVVAATFLAASGVAALAVTAGEPELADVVAHGRDTTFSTTAPATAAVPITATLSPAWWPLPEPSAADAMYRGAVAATAAMLAAREQLRAAVAAIADHARAAYPRECCGFVVASAAGLHAIRCENVATAADAYAFADADVLTFVRSLDSPAPARLVYHSHPNGRAYFSDRDRAVAATPAGPVYPVGHLVVGIDDTGPREAAVYTYDPATAGYTEVARFALPC
nr:Mov34/MPN/PAD-1 family protein [Kofleriaceae bacterium]